MKFLLPLFLSAFFFDCFSQNSPPWEHPLMISWSQDGTNFTNTSVFQDSSGVPSVLHWKRDTLVSVFQWFRQPVNSVSWDKVAVKFSYDNGLSWTVPVPIVVNGFPPNYQRPFDPTLAVIGQDSLRIYYSSSNGMPSAGGDSIINTYSAVSIDGINYSFESGARFDHPSKRVIDPAAIFFNGAWHYCAPAGAPQDGAFHATSSDGINFLQQNDYTSDMIHNWTGNFMIENSGELRFYGSGPQLWFNTSNDGFNWQGYVNTNLFGGDPAALKIDSTNYLIIYTGPSYNTGLSKIESRNLITVTPNPFVDFVEIEGNFTGQLKYKILKASGEEIKSGITFCNKTISLADMNKGIYLLQLSCESFSETVKIIK